MLFWVIVGMFICCKPDVMQHIRRSSYSIWQSSLWRNSLGVALLERLHTVLFQTHAVVFNATQFNSQNIVMKKVSFWLTTAKLFFPSKKKPFKNSYFDVVQNTLFIIIKSQNTFKLKTTPPEVYLIYDNQYSKYIWSW